MEEMTAAFRKKHIKLHLPQTYFACYDHHINVAYINRPSTSSQASASVSAIIGHQIFAFISLMADRVSCRKSRI